MSGMDHRLQQAMIALANVFDVIPTHCTHILESENLQDTM